MKTLKLQLMLYLPGVMLLLSINGMGQSVTKIAAGYDHTLFLKSDGSLWSMGLNYNGQLGDGTFDNTNRPQLIATSNVAVIAAGGDSYSVTKGHSLFLKNDGSLWVLGDNQYGQLGDGTYGDFPHYGTNLPEMIIATNVLALAAGGSHSLLLKSDGSLWAMGNNLNGQLGDGTYTDADRPETIVASNVTAIAAGENHSLFLKKDGSLWAMGVDIDGELGDGKSGINLHVNIPEKIVAYGVTAIAAGGFHSLFLKNDGSLWVMGGNSNGQLGDGYYNQTNLPEQIVASNVTAIAAGERHSLFIKRDGSMWGMGQNDSGELGDGSYNQTNLPEQIVANNVSAIAAGGNHSLYIKTDGSLWAMGNNIYGQLGDGTNATFSLYGSNSPNHPEQIVVNPFYNKISSQLFGTGSVQLSFVGIAGKNYTLDWSASLSLPSWKPIATNPAGFGGTLIFTNTPDPTTNNFWRIRTAP